MLYSILIDLQDFTGYFCFNGFAPYLRSHIEAMGGQLEVVARFPEGVVKIINFADLDGQTTAE
jgi:hypothetical protein